MGAPTGRAIYYRRIPQPQRIPPSRLDLKKLLVIPKPLKEKIIKKTIETNKGKFDYYGPGDEVGTPLCVKLDKTGKFILVTWDYEEG